MVLRTTVGQVLVNDALPERLRDYTRVLDSKEYSKLFQTLATEHPEQYRNISKRLSDIGYQSAYETGGFTFGIDHLMVPDKAKKIKDALREEVKRIVNDSRLTEAEKERRIITSTEARSKPLEEAVMNEALKNKNPLALQVISGARGYPSNLRSVIGSDLLYVDHRQNAIPIPVLSSYSQGLRPHEYWAGTFGTRSGVTALKFATRDAGALAKQYNQVAHRLIVTEPDGDHNGELRGVPMPTDDPDNAGALLAQPIAGYKRNTVLTPQVLAKIRDKGHTRILIRSPILGGPAAGGLYAADVGVRERGGLAPVGDNVGMAAVQALAEPVTQSQISAKHKGGVAGATGALSGFKYIDQLVQVPKTFAGGATHAQTDGRVGAIYPAPQGGHYLWVAGQRHYVTTGLMPTVKRGDEVEAGDVLSEGLANPAEMVKHKGVGEGRRYFIDVMRDMYKNSELKAHRRNIELLSRGLINHVRLHEEVGDYLPDDIVPYDVLEHGYEPRPGAAEVEPKRAAGKYLERPILHYTIGTKVRPSVIKELKNFGVKKVTVHHEPPPFESVMVRAEENLQHDPDWMTRHLGTNLPKGQLRAAHRGAVSDEEGTSFVPPLARGIEFGQVGLIKGWKPNTGSVLSR